MKRLYIHPQITNVNIVGTSSLLDVAQATVPTGGTQPGEGPGDPFAPKRRYC